MCEDAVHKLDMAWYSGPYNRLVDGVGKCSVKVAAGQGCCDEPAYGWRYRDSPVCPGYPPGLACPEHGGPPDPSKPLQHRKDPLP